MASRPCCLFLFLDFHNWAPSVYEVLDLRGAIVSNSLLDVRYCFRCLENNPNGIVQPTGMVVHLTKMAVSQHRKTPTNGKNSRFCVKMTCKYKSIHPFNCTFLHQLLIRLPGTDGSNLARARVNRKKSRCTASKVGGDEPGMSTFLLHFLWRFLTC